MGIRVKLKCCLICFLFLLILTSPTENYAAWTGPQVLVRGTWGASNNQFGFVSGDSGDQFPTSFIVFSDGRIMIDDSINGRSLLYKSNGALIKAITTEDTYAVALGGFNDGKLIAFDWDEAKQTRRIGVYDLITEGWSWIDTITNFAAGKYKLILNGNDFIVGNGNKGYKYSTSGQLIKTYSGHPAELGSKKSSRRQSDGTYVIVIEYPDVTFQVKASNKDEFFYRDLSSHLYVVAYAGLGENQNYRVYKYSLCGKTLGLVDLPTNDIVEPEFIQNFPGQLRPRPIFNGEYGQPVIAPNGDVFTWKRSDTDYSILKWTWVDDPNVPTGPDAPSGLAVTPSINGLYLTWQASPNDPGCVTKYEITRATTSGGVFTTLPPVEKGVLKYNDTTAEVGTTYYYKVRAMAGSDPSAYTSEVSGKR